MTIYTFMLASSPEQAVVLLEFIDGLRAKHPLADFLAITGSPR